MKVLLNNISFPEGPAFDLNGNIWIVEKESGNLISINNQNITRYFVDGCPNGIAVDDKNKIWFCDSKQNSIRHFDPETQKTKTIITTVENRTLKMPNDLAFDNQENLLFTCPGDNLLDGTGYICCYDSRTKKTNITTNKLQYPNGLAFTKDFKQLYVAETGTHIIWKFEWNSNTLELSNGIKWTNTGGPIGPDGIAIDDSENVYIAVYGSSQVKVFNKNGQLINQINTIGKNPTNCAIGPKIGLGLIITEAEHGQLIQVPLNAKGIL